MTRTIGIIIVVLGIAGVAAFTQRERIGCFFYLRSSHEGQIAYLRDDGVYVMDSNGSNQCKIADDNYYTYISWSPDAAELALGNVESQLSLIHADGSDLRPLTSAILDHPDAVPAWSPDGRQMAYNNVSNDITDIATIDVDSHTSHSLTSQLSAHAPVWSPDGTQIAFTAGENELYVMNAGGSDLRLLTHDVYAHIGPTWSPDSQRIAFADTRFEVSLIGADGSGETQLTNLQESVNGQIFKLVWSPTEDQIAAEVIVGESPTRTNLFVVDAKTGAARSLSPREYHAIEVSWQPDGEWLLYTLIRDTEKADAEREIYRVNVQTGENTLLAIGGTPVSNAA